MSTPAITVRRSAEPLRACLFDLDGVITQTAVLHRAAWKEMFDAFLVRYAAESVRPQRPFDDGDYEKFVDGRPRWDGVRSFLASRSIDLPEGTEADPAGANTVRGLGRAKNDLVTARIRAGDVEVYPGSVRFLHAVRDAGLAVAVVSSSANTRDVLEAVGLGDTFAVRIDGQVAAERHLPGKPHPDTFLAGAQALGCPPARAAVFEDALAGVEAGRAGGFGLVVGVDRVGGDHAQELVHHGADVVVADLADLDLALFTGGSGDGGGSR